MKIATKRRKKAKKLGTEPNLIPATLHSIPIEDSFFAAWLAQPSLDYGTGVLIQEDGV